MARLWTLAFTDRVVAARGLLSEQASTLRMPPSYAALFDRTFAALDGAGTRMWKQAVADNLELGRHGPGAAIPAINHLCALGAHDEVFMVANAWLRHQGPLVVAQDNPAELPSVNEIRRRKTLMLFLPSAAGLRADPRFAELMSGIGLMQEWARSGLKPDYQLAG